MDRISCLLGIDVGTTTIKVAAYEPNGNCLTLHRSQTPTKKLGEGLAEHDADELWSVVADLIRTATETLTNKYRIEAVAPATVGEAGVFVDKSGKALHPIIAWFDTRSKKQADWWAREVGPEKVYSITGMPLDTYFGANKLLWVREQMPDIYKQARWWLSVGDLIINRLCGTFSTDQTLASRTMLFDQSKRSWSQELIEAARIDPNLFPPVYPSGTQVGVVTEEAAVQTHLPAGTPVVTGGHDHLCGAYIARQGKDTAVDSTGTAEVVVIPTKKFQLPDTKEMGYFYHYADVVPDRYIYSARIGYAGAIVEWFRNMLQSQNRNISDAKKTGEYKDLLDQIPTPLQYSGLMCYTTFGRVIAPAWNPDEIFGLFMGLTINHHVGHLIQAILEGTCYSLKRNLETIEQLTKKPIVEFRVEGGATKNPIWMQLKADISGRVIESIQLDETTVLGAAILAGVGVGGYGNHIDAAQKISIDRQKWEPETLRKQVYDRVYRDVYLQLPQMVRPINHALRGIVEN
jgi:xylulokinase